MADDSISPRTSGVASTSSLKGLLYGSSTSGATPSASNQLDLRERNAQVLGMDGTYRDASYVSVWLGLPPPVSRYSRGYKSRTSDDDDTFDWTSPMAELIRHSYWSRAWIIQEYLLANEVQIWCGPNCIGWEDFQQELYLSKNPKKESSRAFILGSQRISYIRPSPVLGLESRRLALYMLLEAHYLAECKDPRDKVFSLLGLIWEYERERLGSVFPDYTLGNHLVALLTLAHTRYHWQIALLRMDKVFKALGVRSKAQRQLLLRQAEELAEWLEGPGIGDEGVPFYPSGFKPEAARIMARDSSNESKKKVRRWIVLVPAGVMVGLVVVVGIVLLLNWHV